jgi:hypothetical protein
MGRMLLSNMRAQQTGQALESRRQLQVKKEHRRGEESVPILGDDEAKPFSGLASLDSLDVHRMDQNSLLENDCLRRANHAVPVSFIVHQDLHELMSRVLATDQHFPVESRWNDDCRTGRSLTRNRTRYQPSDGHDGRAPASGRSHLRVEDVDT